MIRASGINVVMEGPEFLQYAETGMILKKNKGKSNRRAWQRKRNGDVQKSTGYCITG